MNRALTGLFCAVVLALSLLPSVSRADSVTYVYAALPGPIGNCQWFDAHLNDRDTGALAQIVDLLYNRAALTPGTPVTITQSGATDSGVPLSAFTIQRTAAVRAERSGSARDALSRADSHPNAVAAADRPATQYIARTT